MDTNTILRLLSKMDYRYEIHSDTPGITFDNGFKSYNELPTPSEILRMLDNGDYADRHPCRSVGGDILETKLRVCPFCGSKVELIDEADDKYFGYSELDEWTSLPTRYSATNVVQPSQLAMMIPKKMLSINGIQELFLMKHMSSVIAKFIHQKNRRTTCYG